LAYRTVRHVFPELAIVFVEEKSINTHATVVAMGEVFSAADAAEPALITVVRFLAV
jgi:hypothetical protein